MAITTAAMNTALGGDVNKNLPKVVRELPPFGTVSQYWVIDGGVTYQDRQRRVTTTAADNAATQAAAVVVALKAGIAP
jgi:hypothetical protein